MKHAIYGLVVVLDPGLSEEEEAVALEAFRHIGAAVRTGIIRESIPALQCSEFQGSTTDHKALIENLKQVLGEHCGADQCGN
jgi:hypothetical protein